MVAWLVWCAWEFLFFAMRVAGARQDFTDLVVDGSSPSPCGKANLIYDFGFTIYEVTGCSVNARHS